MSRLGTLALGLLLTGCPRPPPPELPELLLDDGSAELVIVQELVEPGPWSEPGGLSLRVPEGWGGHTGPEGSSLLLALTHSATGARFEIWAFAHTGTVGPRPRPGCTTMFEDRSYHRAVPALAPAVTATCVSDEPSGPVVQGWYAVVGEREIHVEVVYPPGRVVECRQAADPLLASLSRF